VPAGAGIGQPAASRRPQRGRRRALRAADQGSRRRAFGFVKAAYTVDETLDPLSIGRIVLVLHRAGRHREAVRQRMRLPVMGSLLDRTHYQVAGVGVPRIHETGSGSATCWHGRARDQAPSGERNYARFHIEWPSNPGGAGRDNRSK
jgi:hypothetical protein